MTDYDDVYARITNTIIADLQKELPAWRQPWSHLRLDTYVFDPKTPWEDTYFEAFNTVLLWKTALEKGYTSPFWMTAEQALNLDARVRVDEAPTNTVYDDPVTLTDLQFDGAGQPRKLHRIRAFPVYNAAQIDGLPRALFMNMNPSKQLPPSERIKELDQFFRQTNADGILSGTAGYLIQDDVIAMPPFECFDDAPSYYARLAHELIHWTRHPSRLNRAPHKAFGDADYAKEELIAELGASFLMAYLGMEPVVSETHAAYIKPWLQELQNDKAIVLDAAVEARRAVEYVQGLQPPTNDASMKPTAPTPRP